MEQRLGSWGKGARLRGDSTWESFSLECCQKPVSRWPSYTTVHIPENRKEAGLQCSLALPCWDCWSNQAQTTSGCCGARWGYWSASAASWYNPLESYGWCVLAQTVGQRQGSLRAGLKEPPPSQPQEPERLNWWPQYVANHSNIHNAWTIIFGGGRFSQEKDLFSVSWFSMPADFKSFLPILDPKKFGENRKMQLSIFFFLFYSLISYKKSFVLKLFLVHRPLWEWWQLWAGFQERIKTQNMEFHIDSRLRDTPSHPKIQFIRSSVTFSRGEAHAQSPYTLLLTHPQIASSMPPITERWKVNPIIGKRNVDSCSRVSFGLACQSLSWRTFTGCREWTQDIWICPGHPTPDLTPIYTCPGQPGDGQSGMKTPRSLRIPPSESLLYLEALEVLLECTHASQEIRELIPLKFVNSLVCSYPPPTSADTFWCPGNFKGGWWW